MKKVLLSLAFTISLVSSQAYHIVGGEIEFIYLSDGLYRLNLIQYLDEVQEGNPNPTNTPADAFVTLYIFRNSDDQLMSVHTLPLTSIENVEYTNIECVRDELQTSRIFYSLDIELSPELYDDPEGYYIQWERCCRNASINNIVNPSDAGMNYVLDIPPLMKDGKVFVNSSPILFRPLSDYACINQFYYVEFTGVDPDGDSLVYSLATPLNSSAFDPVPIPQPKPHDGVIFLDEFSVDDMVGGTRPLRISNKGLLTVTPDETGLYVFSVRVEEFRDGEKIGETRRDFQMLVVDGCDPPDPPVVDIEIPSNPTFNPDTDVLTYVASDVEKCFDFVVSNITVGETISLKAEGVNFDERLDEIFSLNQIPVGDGTSQLQIEVCIPDCPPIRDAPFILDLIAADNACPLPQLDTMRITIEVEPPPNSKPVGSTSTGTVSLAEDSPLYSQIINGSDADGDDLEMTLFVEDVDDPTALGFDLINVSGTPGNIQGTVTWDTNCESFDFSEIQNFNVGVIINDGDICDVPGDTVFIDATVILPPNTDPQVSLSTSLPSQVDLGTTLSTQVQASDADGDDLTLTLVGANFDLATYGVSFDPVSGNSNVTSNFSWDLRCNASRYADGQEFELLFIADDDDKCKVKNFDTLRHVVQVNYPANTSPQFDPVDRNPSFRVNESAELEIGAFDLDPDDEITIQFAQGVRQPASGTLEFEPVTGQGRATAILRWEPECTLLRLGETSTLQDIIVQVSDNACPIANIDTLKLTVEIFDDRERQKAFLPPNIFTPNGDGKNDFFSLSGNLDQDQNLPPDNCDNTFEFIVISNRAGAPVFRSESRDFVWSGGQFPSGIYYYVIKYTNSEFKGYVHLIK